MDFVIPLRIIMKTFVTSLSTCGIVGGASGDGYRHHLLQCPDLYLAGLNVRMLIVPGSQYLNQKR